MHKPDLDQLITLADFEAAALRTMTVDVHSYVAGGAGDEHTLRDNNASWSRIAIAPRVLSGADRCELGVELLGRRRAHPIIVAPTAFQGLTHPDGELATARAAQATESIFCLSTFSSQPLDAVAAAVPEAGNWFQLYVLNDRAMTRDLVQQAADRGFEALVVTVDLPVLGIRERELRNPVAEGEPVLGAAAIGAEDKLTPVTVNAEVDPSLDWHDIEQIVAESSIPVLLKGILTAADARKAAELGVAGVVVSNHGGRQLDTVLATADALAEIVDEVGDRVDVLVDGGIRRGTDVLKALALGARAVLIGRPVIYGLAVAGERGAQRVLEILRDEFDTAMRLAGATGCDDLDRSFVLRAPW